MRGRGLVLMAGAGVDDAVLGDVAVAVADGGKGVGVLGLVLAKGRGRIKLPNMLLFQVELASARETTWPLPAVQEMGQIVPTVTLEKVVLTNSACWAETQAARAARMVAERILAVVVISILALNWC